MDNPLAMSGSEWPYLHALLRIVLALALGLFVGLERERRGKEAGVRTFAFAALLGCLGAQLGEQFALLSLALLGLLVVLLNIERIYTHQDTELTTSAALLVVGFAGVLSGQGHTLLPSALTVLTAALLAWKESLAGFSLGLTETELRSAILLAVFAFVIYPALPEESIDPFGLVRLRAAWMTVLLIAGIGFANYVLLKLYGPRAVELTGFFGGLVNSSIAVTALAERVQEGPTLAGPAYRGILLATVAMVLRNGVLLAILAPRALVTASPALLLMLLAGISLAGLQRRSSSTPPSESPILQLDSPFSLSSVLKFGLLFLGLEITGTVAQRALGQVGFYAISLVGGLISSASGAAAAALLASHHSVPADVAGTGVVLTSLMSALVNLSLVARVAHERSLTRRTAWSLGFLLTLGVVGAIAGALLLPDWLTQP